MTIGSRDLISRFGAQETCPLVAVSEVRDRPFEFVHVWPAGDDPAPVFFDSQVALFGIASLAGIDQVPRVIGTSSRPRNEMVMGMSVD